MMNLGGDELLNGGILIAALRACFAALLQH